MGSGSSVTPALSPPHRLVVALATCRRAAGLVALGAVRLGVVKRVVELGRL